jgi:hypothetical protein
LPAAAADIPGDALYPDIVHTWACTEGVNTKTDINANATEEIEVAFIATISMRRSLTGFSADLRDGDVIYAIA